jgi:uncharacterized protein HemY
MTLEIIFFHLIFLGLIAASSYGIHQGLLDRQRTESKSKNSIFGTAIFSVIFVCIAYFIFIYYFHIKK